MNTIGIILIFFGYQILLFSLFVVIRNKFIFKIRSNFLKNFKDDYFNIPSYDEMLFLHPLIWSEDIEKWKNIYLNNLQ